MTECTKVAAYVIVERNRKILLGKRKNSFGAGQYTTPTGHLEFNETLVCCAQRELMEETGLNANSFQLVAVRDGLVTKGSSNNHYVIGGFKAFEVKGEPQNTEPDKNEGWEWHDLEKLPEPMFPHAKMIVESYLKSKIYV